MFIFLLQGILVLLKILSALISIILIGVSLFRVPEKNVGLGSIANKISLLGSPSSSQRSTDIIGVITILIYLTIAFLLNLIIISNNAIPPLYY